MCASVAASYFAEFLQSLGEKSEIAVKHAIDCGYRHIDTAYVYGNEAEIGNVVRQKIAEKVVTRSEMFITSKVIYYPQFYD